MNCENIFCAYNKKRKCTVEASIGINGSCESCIYVDIEQDYLNYLKDKMLKSWEDADSISEDSK